MKQWWRPFAGTRREEEEKEGKGLEETSVLTGVAVNESAGLFPCSRGPREWPRQRRDSLRVQPILLVSDSFCLWDRRFCRFSPSPSFSFSLFLLFSLSLCVVSSWAYEHFFFVSFLFFFLFVALRRKPRINDIKRFVRRQTRPHTWRRNIAGLESWMWHKCWIRDRRAIEVAKIDHYLWLWRAKGFGRKERL